MLETLLSADPYAAAALCALVLARLLPLAFGAPFVAPRGAPPSARVAVALALTACLAPPLLLGRLERGDAAIASAAIETPWAFALAIVRELALGTTLAIAGAAAFWALMIASGLLDARANLTGSALADAGTGDVSGPLQRTTLALGVALFVATGGHLVALEALALSLHWTPPGAPALPTLALTQGLSWVGQGLALSAALTAPIAAAFVLADLLIAGVHRVSPAMRQALEAAPSRVVWGVAVFALVIGRWLDVALAQARAMLQAWASGWG